MARRAGRCERSCAVEIRLTLTPIWFAGWPKEDERDFTSFSIEGGAKILRQVLTSTVV